ncbi:effector-associated domain 2-containing protein [Streptomyces fodineus]|uniref:effector-associated domain 2-containing protein n=1 Tax=Streptomyces fodineus TaxID=1904616 RepID=UPI00131EC0E7|nr:trypsin-like peptidase domain-containing protein [Streptomyces fodineus]
MHGAGILVRPGVVLTCAHVVVSAAGPRGGRSEAVSGHSVLVDVPGRPDVAAGEATVAPDGWYPGPLAGGPGGDLAVLRTAWSPPDGTAVARLGRCGEPDRREVAAYGHPAGAPDGLWSRARLVGRGGPYRDWIQLEGLGSAGAPVGRGFSGAGVWDPAARRVIGMVTAAYTDQQAKVAWMLPLEAAAHMWPDLAPALAGPEPETATVPKSAAGEASSPPPPDSWPEPPSDKDQFALADALLAVPQIEDDGAATLRGLLPSRIRHTVRTHSRPRLQLFFLVQACAQHPHGRQALIDALRMLDDGSRPARTALELLDRLWPAAPGGGSS